MNTLYYIFNKIYILFLSYRYKSKKIENNIYLFNPEYTGKNKKVLFYFPDASLMHVGDNLFFEPICRLFQSNGFDVSIFPSNPVREYFSKLGYNFIGEQIHLEQFDTVISSSRFIQSLSKLKQKVVLLETECPDINKALINDLQEKISNLFDFTTQVDPKPALPFVPFDSDTFLNSSDQYILFSNYLVSGSFRVFKSKHDKLRTFAENYKLQNPNIKIIHVGSPKDKSNDSNVYPFIDIDLRGKTSILEIFSLVKSPEIIGYIGFDNFLMHVFFILDKNVTIMSRGRWSKKSRYFLHNFIDPPFDISAYKAVKKYIV